LTTVNRKHTVSLRAGFSVLSPGASKIGGRRPVWRCKWFVSWIFRVSSLSSETQADLLQNPCSSSVQRGGGTLSSRVYRLAISLTPPPHQHSPTIRVNGAREMRCGCDCQVYRFIRGPSRCCNLPVTLRYPSDTTTRAAASNYVRLIPSGIRVGIHPPL